MYKRITLASGNVYFFFPGNNDKAPYGFIIDNYNNFVGGYLCNEAIRKAQAFSSLKNTIVQDVTKHPAMETVKFENFAEKLGTASKWFIQYGSLVFNDLDYCNGTNSRAESCDDRYCYYKAVGCEMLFKSKKEFPLWAFIANHLAIFSQNNFRITFFRGNEEFIGKDRVVENIKTRYYNSSFKAPAAYVRALCSNV